MIKSICCYLSSLSSKSNVSNSKTSQNDEEVDNDLSHSTRSQEISNTNDVLFGDSNLTADTDMHTELDSPGRPLPQQSHEIFSSHTLSSKDLENKTIAKYKKLILQKLSSPDSQIKNSPERKKEFKEFLQKQLLQFQREKNLTTQYCSQRILLLQVVDDLQCSEDLPAEFVEEISKILIDKATEIITELFSLKSGALSKVMDLAKEKHVVEIQSYLTKVKKEREEQAAVISHCTTSIAKSIIEEIDPNNQDKKLFFLQHGKMVMDRTVSHHARVLLKTYVLTLDPAKQDDLAVELDFLEDVLNQILNFCHPDRDSEMDEEALNIESMNIESMRSQLKKALDTASDVDLIKINHWMSVLRLLDECCTETENKEGSKNLSEISEIYEKNLSNLKMDDFHNKRSLLLNVLSDYVLANGVDLPMKFVFHGLNKVLRKAEILISDVFIQECETDNICKSNLDHYFHSLCYTEQGIGCINPLTIARIDPEVDLS